MYDTKAQFDIYQKKYLNINNPENIPDVIYNIQSLKTNCPNIKWVSPVISWFGVVDLDTLDIQNIKIMPGVEHRDEKTQEAWNVLNLI